MDDCIKSAIDYGVFAFEVVKNARITNRLYDKDYNNFKKLKYYGEKGILELEKLFEHPNDYVKYGAAAHLLSANEENIENNLKMNFICQINSNSINDESIDFGGGGLGYTFLSINCREAGFLWQCD